MDRFLAGDISREELELLDSAMGDRPDEAFDSYVKSIWESTASGNANIPDKSRTDRMKEKVIGRINIQEDVERRFARRRRWLSIAVSSFAAAVLAAVVTVCFLLIDNRQILEYEVVADRGQKSSVTLPDGSRVWLNSASRICYTSEFNKDNRNIILDGEAYFEVAKNKKIPFVVYASGMSVTAVGTEFNVRNYPDEGEVTATLVQGRVMACVEGTSTYLDYGQEAVMNRSSGKMSKQIASDLYHLVPWRSSEILLSGESLEHLGCILSRMYNVDVSFQDENIKKYTYTGLIRNNSLQNVLELISNTSPVDYEMNGDKIVFRTR